MSRSYKHTPYCGDNKSTGMKQIANRNLRRALKRNHDLNLNHGTYKKWFCSYDICDFYNISSWSAYWQNVIRSYHMMRALFPHRHEPYPDKKEEYRYWYKHYRMK